MGFSIYIILTRLISFMPIRITLPTHFIIFKLHHNISVYISRSMTKFIKKIATLYMISCCIKRLHVVR